ncbi:RGCVC family protein [Actinokineospora fastidiosa]|uniref:Uncharacterized protein n=1 Tax=Actinokineospora fastidiosa TaxID=1816 RepID=A0A918GGW1_9PSEU|nr:RGCVC family protein [Actinokineospora fastidiosa]GGS34753.1 hypothetical protein GCM10010171_31560 [Actinokineospora fastidiosa]
MSPDLTPECPACPHPLSAHDATARRFCAAMAASGRTRRCLCSGESAGMTYSNSTRAPISGDADRER